MRIVIFTDSNSVTPARLVRATVRWTQRGAGSLAGIVTTRPESFPSGPAQAARALARRIAVAATNADVPAGSVLDDGFDLFRLARRQRVPVLVPSDGDPNDPAFVRELVDRLRPDVALSFFCSHRFRRRLLSAFEHAVNYHDGLLPDYRGVMATSFSIFVGERQSGYSFHRMTARLDRGPILMQGAVALEAESTLHGVSRAKSALAAEALPQVLERVMAGDPGRAQPDGGRYFSAHDWMALTHLSNPGNALKAQIEKRIRAFGIVHTTIGGKSYPVTRLRVARPGARLGFVTDDGWRLEPDRLAGLPAAFHRSEDR